MSEKAKHHPPEKSHQKPDKRRESKPELKSDAVSRLCGFSGEELPAVFTGSKILGVLEQLKAAISPLYVELNVIESELKDLPGSPSDDKVKSVYDSVADRLREEFVSCEKAVATVIHSNASCSDSKPQAGKPVVSLKRLGSSACVASSSKDEVVQEKSRRSKGQNDAACDESVEEEMPAKAVQSTREDLAAQRELHRELLEESDSLEKSESDSSDSSSSEDSDDSDDDSKKKRSSGDEEYNPKGERRRIKEEEATERRSKSKNATTRAGNFIMDCSAWKLHIVLLFCY